MREQVARSLGALALATLPIHAQLQQVARLEASDGLPGDQFGASVDVVGGTLIIGAPGTDAPEPATQTCFAGSAYVFERNEGVWTQTQRLDPSDAQCKMRFGDAVATTGDTIAVGAHWHDGASVFPGPSGCDSGAVYVFERVQPGGEWVEQQILVPSNSHCSMEFGAAVAMDGDWMVVGAPRDANSAVPTPSAFVFRREGGVWTEDQQLVGSTTTPFDLFGRSVAISGRRLVVGAPHADSSRGGVGVGYVFVRKNGGWVEEARLETGSIGIHKFGQSADLRGGTIVLGARGESSPNGGAVLWRRLHGIWTEELTVSKPKSIEQFGTSVALDRGAFLVGAEEADDADPSDAGCDSGALYAYERDTERPYQIEHRITADPAVCSDHLGHVMAASNGTLVTGGGTHVVYVFERGRR